MEKVTLPKDLVNVILQYMSTKPYKEVYQIVDSIMSESVVVNKEEQAEE